MSTFLLYSTIASVVLTVLFNLLPLIFPGIARRAEARMRAQAEAIRRGESPRVRFLFPWKAMLPASIVLTIVMNAIAWFSGHR